MYAGIEDKMSFIESYLGANIDEVHENENDTLLDLSDGSCVEATDTRCVHNYTIGETKETADMSLEYREYILERLSEKGDERQKINYCRSCILAIEKEFLNVIQKSVNPESKADLRVYSDQANALQEQSLKMLDIINNTSVNDLNEPEM